MVTPVEHESLRSYFERSLGWGRGHESRAAFAFLTKAAAFATGGVVLDAGAGHQRYKPFFHASVYVAQEHPIAGARNKGITEYDILSDVRTIPLNDGCVDLVLSTSSLEHMEFPQEFFREALRVLKPGGALYIHVPFLLPEHEKPFDFQRPTSHGLERWYRHAGFEGMEVKPTGSAIDMAQNLMLLAIKEDGRRLGFVGKGIAGAIYLSAKALVGLAVKFLDRGPFDDSIMPGGWFAIGHKPGERVAGTRYASVSEFLGAHHT